MFLREYDFCENDSSRQRSFTKMAIRENDSQSVESYKRISKLENKT